jgi:hypothetical protein
MRFSIALSILIPSFSLFTLGWGEMAVAQNASSLPTSTKTLTAKTARNSQNPTVPNLETASLHLPSVSGDSDGLACYMQTADGKVLNLIRLCGQPSVAAPVSEPALTPGIYACDPVCRP